MKCPITIWAIDAQLYDGQWTWNDKTRITETVIDSAVWEDDKRLLIWLIDQGYLRKGAVSETELEDVADYGVEVRVRDVPVLFLELGSAP